MKYALTVAVIGTGYMGEIYAKTLSGLVDKMVFCSTDEKKGRALAEQYGSSFYTDYLELFGKERVDFAAICLPTYLHAKASVAAMERGINVICEKPFAPTVAEASEMIKAAEKNGVTLMIAHCLRFSKGYEYLRRCLADGRFGRLLALNSFREHKSPKWSVNNWLHNTALSGGVVKDAHIHDTDMLIGWLGKPESVYTAGNSVACRTVYNYGEGVLVSSSASWRDVDAFSGESGYDAFFENACVKVKNHKLTVCTNDEIFDPTDREEFSEFFAGNIYENELKYFCHCVTAKVSPELCPLEDSLATISVNCAEARSLEARAEEKIN